MTDSFMLNLQAIGGIFAGGAALVMILARFNIRRVLEGELGARYIGWLLLLPVYAIALYGGTGISLIILTLTMLLGLIEYGRAAEMRQPDLIALCLTVPLSLLLALVKPQIVGALPVLVLFLLTLLPFQQNTPERIHSGRARLILWGYVYVVWTLTHAALIWHFPGGRELLVVLIVGCALSDIGAYVIGKRIGKTLIAPRISPTKCWEGLIGDFLGAGLAVALLGFNLPPMSFPALVGLVLIIGLGSAWGDLLSSLAKRNAGIKDWGNLIPGHGGLLDRLNSLIVVLPLVYYFMVAFVYR